MIQARKNGESQATIARQMGIGPQQVRAYETAYRDWVRDHPARRSTEMSRYRLTRRLPRKKSFGGTVPTPGLCGTSPSSSSPGAPRSQECTGVHGQCRQLTEARREFPWLAAGSCTIQQQALRDFDQAMRRFFDGTNRMPGFRKAARNEGFCVVDVGVITGLSAWGAEPAPFRSRRWDGSSFAGPELFR